ncbi:MAG: copper homeostasis protein CutC [Acidobacteriaceae bacterium]
MVLEICADSVDSAIAAERGGAHRLELCSDLLEGGITPSHGLMAQVRNRIAIELYVLIRPRGGDFCYSDSEMESMEDDIVHARSLGADGITLGVLDDHAHVDVDRTRRLVQRADPLPVTFHRAIDMTPDPSLALPAVIATGAQRVLTSGGAAKVNQGLAAVARMVQAAGSRIRVMAGGGITALTLADVAQATGASEFHASLRTAWPGPVQYRRQSVTMGELSHREYTRYGVQETDVRALADVLQRIGEERAAALLHSGSRR